MIGKYFAEIGDTVEVGAQLYEIDPEGKAGAAPAKSEAKKEAPKAEAPKAAEPKKEEAKPAAAAPAPAAPV